MKNIASISSKTLGYTAKAIRKLVEDSKGETVFLARVGGIVESHFIGESKNGEWVGFKGQFIAVTKDNEQITAKVAFFPAGIANQLRQKLEQGLVECEVKADIYAVETDKNASGYAYMCEPVITQEAMDKFARLTASVGSAPLPQLSNNSNQAKIEAPKKAGK